ncbi:hypothetical protein EJ110_NYTH52702 [Nymphaea thermarum]|nr:hypothetical protein EJ110_NYTH52702 [Nymphaea thermarum]
MAMRSGSGHGASMIVTNTPSPDLALTNLAYCSAHDVRKFAVHAAGSALAVVGDTVVLSLQYPLDLLLLLLVPFLAVLLVCILMIPYVKVILL